ncbi:23S rRNA (uracil(1939)-C(5))-methyltransferase RlmD [Fusibacter sp. JL216-2]|uniref:23S rRNA (uracil(1939)-C(5))-methyltransferase RlmD n=1 Tax=Fusibacter sp. JL216-2 TaxID=3071453 RepID=UPI003D346C62
MKRGSIIELTIDRVAFPSKAIGTYEGHKIQVKGALPGQKIKARIKKKKQNRIDATVLEVLEQAPNEVESFCPHFGRCGGCARQTLSYEDQVKLKGDQVQGLLEEAGVKDYEWGGVVASPEIYHYRNKMEYSFGDEEKGGPLTLGMHKKGRYHDVVTVDQCKIADKDFNVILAETHKHFIDRGIAKYDGVRHTGGYLRNLNVRKGKKTGEILIGLSTSSHEEHDLKPYVDMLLDLKLQGHIVGILHIVNDGIAQVVRGDYDVLYGRDYYMEELFDLKFRVSFYSFFQTNTLGAEVLYEKAMEYMDHIESRNVFDLFSGTGTIAQIMAERADHVTGIEIIEDAVKAAEENAKLNKLDNCDFLAGDVFVKLDEVKKKPDVIVVDPPRVGIHEKTLSKILDYGVKGITYISCNPVSLAENLKQMQEAGYSVKKVCCVDMFPHTPHVETVVRLQRQNP